MILYSKSKDSKLLFLTHRPAVDVVRKVEGMLNLYLEYQFPEWEGKYNVLYS